MSTDEGPRLIRCWLLVVGCWKNQNKTLTAEDAEIAENIRELLPEIRSKEINRKEREVRKGFLEFSAFSAYSAVKFSRRLRVHSAIRLRSVPTLTTNNQQPSSYLLAIFAHLARSFRNGKAACGLLAVCRVVSNGCILP